MLARGPEVEAPIIEDVARVSKADPREDSPSLQMNKFYHRVAHTMTIHRPYALVTEPMTFPKDFYPLMLPLKFGFNLDFPTKFDATSADTLVNQEFTCYKQGLETGSSKFKYVRVEYSASKLHSTITLINADKSAAFSQFYNTIIVEPDPSNPEQTNMHYETGYTSSGILPDFLINKLLEPTMLHIDKMNLKQIARFNESPRDAATRVTLTRQLIANSPVDRSEHSNTYRTTITVGCSSAQVLSILGNTKCVAEEIITGKNYDEKTQSFERQLVSSWQSHINKTRQTGG